MNNTKALMIEKLNAHKVELIHQGELGKKLDQSKKKGNEFFSEACVYAANYYTETYITELHSKTIKVLKKDDFLPQDYILKFKNAETIKKEDIEFLNERANEIFKIEQNLSNSSFPEKKMNRFREWLIGVADSLNGGDRSAD
jgi:hypothetical protein